MRTRPFGNTNKEIPILGLGGQRLVDAHGCDEDSAIEIINTALDEGVYYFDTAWSYSSGQSEERIGKVAKHRRAEMWLATKTMETKADGARRQLEESLTRLQTDYVDEWRLHNIWDYDRLDEITREDGAVAAAVRAQEEGLVQHISISCHTDPQILLKAIDRFSFESALFPASVLDHFILSFVEEFLPEANFRGIATIGMKVFGRGLFLLDIERALRYTLSLPLSTTIVGVETLSQLKQNISIANAFTPMHDEERLELFRDIIELVVPGRVRWKAKSKNEPTQWLERESGFWKD